MNTPLIELICDGSRGFGYGHLRRSSALAITLKKRGLRVCFTALSAVDAGVLPPVPQDPGVADLLLVDLPYPGDEWVVHARQTNRPVMTIDYSGIEPPNLNVTVFDHGHLPSTIPQQVGFQYAMIREEVRCLAPAAAGEGVLVLLGGGDVQGMGPVVAAALAAEGERVTLVEGPFVPLRPEREETPFTVLRTPEDLPARMAACGWAVTNGGTSMMEMMCLGKPTHVIPQTEAEWRLALYTLQQGGVLGVGQADLLRSCREKSRHAALSVAANRLVDGAGMARIADAAMALLP